MAWTWTPAARRRRREQELDALEELRRLRRLVAEDVTMLGEQLAGLHVETLTDVLDGEMARHYRSALDHYDQAKERLRTATTAAEVREVEPLAVTARYHAACVLALRDGEPVPQRREPCFFDPWHGPATRDIEWAPPAGASRTISVCASDVRRLAGGEDPETRLVRVGDRWVPWHQAGSSVAQVARSHVHGGHTPHTSAAAAEAQTRASIGGINGAGGAFG